MSEPPDNPAEPLVSIGMPVYNGEKTLAAAIDSILAQSYSNFVLFISDNCSTDATEAICSDYAARDRRIRYTRQATNIGGLNNFVFVLDQAQSAYFVWAAADDTRSPDYLEANVAFLESHPDFVAATSPTRFSDGDFDPMNMGDAPLLGTVEQRFFGFFTSWHANGRFYSLFRRQAIRDCIRPDEEFLGNDWLIVLRCLLRGKFHRDDRGWTVLGRSGASNSGNPFKRARNHWYERIFPFFVLSRGALFLGRSFSLQARVRLALILLRFNAMAVWSQLRLFARSYKVDLGRNGSKP